MSSKHDTRLNKQGLGATPPEPAESPVGPAFRLRDLCDLAGPWPLERFLENYKVPFLVQISVDLEGASQEAGFVTTTRSGLDFSDEADHFKWPVYFVEKGPKADSSPMIKVGRAEDNDIILPSSKISKHHAYLEDRDDGWYVYDLNSSNGTFFGGLKLEPQRAYRIDSTTELFFGASSAFRFFEPKAMFQYFQGLLRLAQRAQRPPIGT